MLLAWALRPFVTRASASLPLRFRLEEAVARTPMELLFSVQQLAPIVRELPLGHPYILAAEVRGDVQEVHELIVQGADKNAPLDKDLATLLGGGMILRHWGCGK